MSGKPELTEKEKAELEKAISTVPKALTPEDTRVCGRLAKKPDPPEYLARYQGRGFLPKGIVGAIVATGGTGKTQWLLQLLIALSGGTGFSPFSIDRPLKTLLVQGEDSSEEIDRRLWNITDGVFPKGFHVAAVRGGIGPFFEFDGNNPITTKYFEWLEDTIAAHEGLDLLVIDPLSRFFGLTENANEHQTAFISAIERLCRQYGITAIVSHHTNKASATSGELHKDGARGGGALSDAIRWQLNARIITEQDANKYDLVRKDHIEVAVTKSNLTDYTGSIYFRKIVDGDDFKGFEHMDPEYTRTAAMAGALCDALAGCETQLSRLDIQREQAGKDAAQQVMDATGCKRGELAKAIDLALERGDLRIEETRVGPTQVKKMVLRPWQEIAV